MNQLNLIYPVLFLTLGMLSVMLFHDNNYLPISISVLLYVGVSVYLLLQFRRKRLGALLLVLWLVYVLPFVHIVPYLWFDFTVDNPPLLWGLVVNPYMLDEEIVRLTGMIGAVGGLGFALGVSLDTSQLLPNALGSSWQTSTRIRVLSLPVWSCWVFAGVVLSWLAAPQEALFTAEYTASVSATRLADANFSSAWMVSYVLLTFALCDAISDRHPERRRFKRGIIFSAMAYVVLILQLLRGDRESMPFIFGAMLAFYYWAPSQTQTWHIRAHWKQIAAGGSIIVIVSMVLGSIRGGLTDIASLGSFLDLLAYLSNVGAIGVNNLLHGTWSSVLLTPLSVAGDHVNGFLDLKFGKTYQDLVLSIPPGFLADWVGYVRPINIDTSPAREMRFGQGGTHATVVPFMNFRMVGVLLIPALWAFLVTRCEKVALRKLHVVNLSLLVTIVMAAPHWLWYGEKDGMNAFLIWLLLSFAYRISLWTPQSLMDSAKGA